MWTYVHDKCLRELARELKPVGRSVVFSKLVSWLLDRTEDAVAERMDLIFGRMRSAPAETPGKRKSAGDDAADEDDANTIMGMVTPASTEMNVNYEVVRDAIYSNLNEMGYKCSDIGVYDDDLDGWHEF